MKTVKKLICVIISIILVASPFALSVSAIDVVGTFPDVPEGAWYYDAVSYCARERYINGYKNGKFGPEDKIQRQDFVLILARISEANLSKYSTDAVLAKFSDVNDKSAYYLQALAWGVATGVVNGYDNGKFGVGDPVTREQICVFICRYLRQAGRNTDVSDSMRDDFKNFRDYNSVSAFAVDSVVWCKANAVVNGTKDGYFNPVKSALRCEVAQIFYNASQKGLFGVWMDI